MPASPRRQERRGRRIVNPRENLFTEPRLDGSSIDEPAAAAQAPPPSSRPNAAAADGASPAAPHDTEPANTEPNAAESNAAESNAAESKTVVALRAELRQLERDEAIVLQQTTDGSTLQQALLSRLVTRRLHVLDQIAFHNDRSLPLVRIGNVSSPTHPELKRSNRRASDARPVRQTVIKDVSLPEESLEDAANRVPAE